MELLHPEYFSTKRDRAEFIKLTAIVEKGIKQIQQNDRYLL